MIDASINHTFEESCCKDPLEKCLAHFEMNFDIEESIEEVNALLDSFPIMDTKLGESEVEPLQLPIFVPIPSIIESSKLKFKLLPDLLEYVFLGDSETLPVIISSHLDENQEGKLLDVLIDHKEALGWTIVDIKRISSSVVMHHSHLEEDAKTSREPQRCLNPVLKEVVGQRL